MVCCAVFANRRIHIHALVTCFSDSIQYVVSPFLFLAGLHVPWAANVVPGDANCNRFTLFREKEGETGEREERRE